MVNIDGRYYFINFEMIDKVLNNGVGATDERIVSDTVVEVVKSEHGTVVSEKITTTNTLKPREVNAFRYQVISAMLDEILHNAIDGEESEIPKLELDKLSIGAKLSFNTLLEYGIMSFIDLEK